MEKFPFNSAQEWGFLFFSLFWLAVRAGTLQVRLSWYFYSHKTAEQNPHASSSKPRPSLWPPALMFFPSTSAERRSFIPEIQITECITMFLQVAYIKKGQLRWNAYLKLCIWLIVALTRSQGLGVSNSYQAGIIHLCLEEENKIILSNIHTWYCSENYTN